MSVIDNLPTVAGAHDAASWRSLPGWTTVAGKSLSLEFQVYGGCFLTQVSTDFSDIYIRTYIHLYIYVSEYPYTCELLHVLWL